MKITAVKGIIIAGHRVASGPSRDYPYGTLEKQKPYFKALGLDLENVYNGTLNISIHPHTFEMKNPEFIFERVEWTDLHPPETFSFSRCFVLFAGNRYASWVYYPHPETKARHFQQPSMIEILSEYIPGLRYGTEIEIELNSEEVQIIKHGMTIGENMQPFFEDYLFNLKELHNDILDALQGLPPAALDWSPAADINSINVLVVHIVGAQRFLIGEVVAGDPANRDREAEFRVRGLEAKTLAQHLDDSLAYIRSALDSLTLDNLASRRDFRGRERSVAWVLSHALKHTATHMGHIQLTRQLWELYGKTGN